ncbi:hypothetical protein [Allobranchiibius sp. GilTou73]|uniref:hypothetical protein n=1 Tax=Allobranchiibius sp. GilTou73 TaxID=2904523 RepID=UPI001F1A768C|nr:hypothetical protein [Allobranchiibius sp. GilTou73]UIJ35979.1 hypothetical protein LVQ62_06270 [Allobranchiibius sp. GilTou73]
MGTGDELGDDVWGVDPWGRHEPAADRTVAWLTAHGWTRLEPAPLYHLMPAVWPAHLRTWVPLEADGDSWPDQDRSGWAQSAGAPPPPANRTWLLQSPWPSVSVERALRLIFDQLDDRLGPDEIPAMATVGRRVLRWDEATALAAIAPHERGLIGQWSERAGDADRAGLDPDVVDRLIDLGYPPADCDRVQADTGWTAAEVAEWSEQTDRTGDELIDFIRRWRTLRLPEDPELAAEWSEEPMEQLGAILDAGFTPEDAPQVRDVGLSRARVWRDAGFDAQDTFDLLTTDPDLLPEEARTFEDPAIAEQGRWWIYYGFSADEALRWSGVGLSPTRARLWRAHAHTPDEVHVDPERWLSTVPPELRPTTEHFAVMWVDGGEYTMDGWDEIADPPATRGRSARRARGETDPLLWSGFTSG